MSLIPKLRHCFRIRDLYLVPIAVRKIINWPIYFIDYLSLNRQKFTIFKMKNSLNYLVRANTWDRGVITRIHLADEYDINTLSLPPDSVVIDIGAHIGIFSVFVSNKAKKIFAFEPVLENFELLRENIKLNNLEHKVRSFNLAVSNNEQGLKIFFSSINTAGHSVYGNGHKYANVKSITLKQIFDDNDIKSCELLKIDAEGSEYRILLNLPDIYFDRIQRIRLEYHKIKTDEQNYNCEFLINFLKDKGFTTSLREHLLFAHK